ncbi:MAG: hypothetical protein ACLRP3_09040 [Escherichia sp.]
MSLPHTMKAGFGNTLGNWLSSWCSVRSSVNYVDSGAAHQIAHTLLAVSVCAMYSCRESSA